MRRLIFFTCSNQHESPKRLKCLADCVDASSFISPLFVQVDFCRLNLSFQGPGPPSLGSTSTLEHSDLPASRVVFVDDDPGNVGRWKDYGTLAGNHAEILVARCCRKNCDLFKSCFVRFGWFWCYCIKITTTRKQASKNLSKHLSPLERKFKPTWPHDFCCK